MISAHRIREATAMDAGGIAAVHVETWRSAYAGLLPDTYLVQQTENRREASWREAIARQRGTKTLVIEREDHEIIGFGDCGRSRASGMPYPGEVYTLYILPDWQNQGLGRELLTALFEELSASGCPSAFLWVLSRNPTRFFYEAMGGEAAAERQERFAGVLLDEIAYAWPDLSGWLAARR